MSFVMNVLTLKRKFERKNVNPSCYYFDHDVISEGYFLIRADLGWDVFYQERGERTAWRWFALENEACEYLHYLIFSDANYSEG